MKLKFYFLSLIIFVFFTINNLYAQKLKLSAEPLDGTGLDYAKVIGDTDDGVYILHSNFSLETERDRIGLKSRKYQLSFYDYSLNRKWIKNISATNPEASIEAIGFFNEQVIVLSSIQEKSNLQYTVFADVFTTSGNLKYSGKVIAKFNYIKGSSFDKPKIILSPTKTNAAICITEKLNNLLNVHVSAIDTAYSIIGNSNGSINNTDQDLIKLDYSVGINNELLMLAEIREKVTDEKRKLIAYELYYLGNNSSQFKEFKIPNYQHQLTEASLTIDKAKNKAVVIGFFADQSSFAGAGITFSSLDLTKNDSLITTTYSVKGDAQLKLVGERNSGNGISLLSYPIQKIILRSDGGAVIFAEAEYTSEYSYYDYFTQSFNRRIEYHFDNVIVFSLNSNGSIDWSQVIRKTQSSMDDLGIYASFSSFINSEDLGIIYNNDIGKNNEIIVKVINNKGQLNDVKVTSVGDNTSIIPRSGKQVDESTIIIPVINKKRLFLAKIEL